MACLRGRFETVLGSKTRIMGLAPSPILTYICGAATVADLKKNSNINQKMIAYDE